MTAHSPITGTRIRPDRADQILIACAVALSASVTDDGDTDNALLLLERALPLTSLSTRIAPLRAAAESVLTAAPNRRRAPGAMAWVSAILHLQRAVASDARAQLLRLLGE